MVVDEKKPVTSSVFRQKKTDIGKADLIGMEGIKPFDRNHPFVFQDENKQCLSLPMIEESPSLKKALPQRVNLEDDG